MISSNPCGTATAASIIADRAALVWVAWTSLGTVAEAASGRVGSTTASVLSEADGDISGAPASSAD